MGQTEFTQEFERKVQKYIRVIDYLHMIEGEVNTANVELGLDQNPLLKTIWYAFGQIEAEMSDEPNLSPRMEKCLKQIEELDRYIVEMVAPQYAVTFKIKMD